MIRVFVVRFNSWDFLSCLATQGKSLFTWQTVALLETKGIAQYWWGHKPRAPHRPRLPHWSLFAAEKFFSTKCIWVLQKTPSSVWFWNVWPSAFSRSYQLPEFDVIRGCFHTKRERETDKEDEQRVVVFFTHHRSKWKSSVSNPGWFLLTECLSVFPGTWPATTTATSQLPDCLSACIRVSVSICEWHSLQLPHRIATPDLSEQTKDNSGGTFTSRNNCWNLNGKMGVSEMALSSWHGRK